MSIVKVGTSQHWYSKDGTPKHDSDLRDARKEGLYPSVTTIDKSVFPAPQLERWKIEQACIAASNQFRQENETPDQYAKRIYEISLEKSKEAANFGTRLHDAIEGHPSAPEDMALLPWFQEFDRWSGRAVKERVSSEKVLLDHDIGVAGRTDAIIIATSGERCVVDYKGLSIDTPLPTPYGWTTMGNVLIGEQLYSSSGKPCRVIGKSERFYRPCYQIMFDDGSKITCDNVHLWSVVNYRSEDKAVETLSTWEILARMDMGDRFQIKNSAPLQSDVDFDLPLDPYFLGAWLGDGTELEGKITLGEKKKQISKYISDLGYNVREYRKDNYYVKGLVTDLKRVGVFGNKHVPPIYMRASKRQRLALLRGLMDTDGNWNKIRNQACFCNTNKLLSDAVYEIVVSLGWKASRFFGTGYGFGVTCNFCRISFTPFGDNPFMLNTWNQPMAQARIAGTEAGKMRRIKSIVATESVPTQCVMVDSPDRLYLAGLQMVPTHNTQDVRTSKSGKKTPSYYDSWARQLAFYAHADAKETGQFPDIPKCLSLVIDSNPGGVVYEKWWGPDEIRDAYLDFLHGAWIFFHSRNFWPRGKWSVCDLKS